MELRKEKIISILTSAGIYDFVKKFPHIYIGGSLPALMFSNKTADYINSKINDIDIYTQNISMCLRDLNREFKLNRVYKSGVNINFTIKKKPIQIISSSFENFETEVLDTYDCDISCVGYYPFTNEFIIGKRFLKGLEEKNFVVYYEKTNKLRIEKLFSRAKDFFSCTLTIQIENNEEKNYSNYYKKKLPINNICELDFSPPYIQMYMSKYKCCVCETMTNYLICANCKNKIVEYNKNLVPKNKIKKLVVFGGVNGFGSIIGTQAELQNINVVRTSRNPKDNTQYKFDLTDGIISPELMKEIMDSDCVIFNAYQTLENEPSIWTTKIEDFDEELSLNRFKINCFGYVKIISQLIAHRKQYIKTQHKITKQDKTHESNNVKVMDANVSNLNNIQDIVLVFMDANESKYQGKLSDGKHLELNMAKSACKQIFYTNAQVLSSLGMITIAWDPCWMSYHGISMDKIESKSKFLIPPTIGADALLSHIKSLDLEKLYLEKTFISDNDFYTWSKSITH